MEIARSRKHIYRRATRGDAGRLSALLKKAEYVHKHADWSFPADWLDKPGFWICERVRDGSPDEIIACLAAAADPPPAAWVRLAAARKETSAYSIFTELIGYIRAQLAVERVTEVGWLPTDQWPDTWLTDMGFELVNWIITYVNFRHIEPVIIDRPVHIRSATLDDMVEMASIEEAAFDPLWRHSYKSLQLAFGQSVCFHAAYLGGRMVGFHYSARGIENDTAHLVRITVHPDAQQQGVGAALMAAAMESYIHLGVRTVTLNTQLDNLASHRLYEKFGFRRIGERIPLWVMDIANRRVLDGET
jgi:ribosomal protein S18 acetylase RimI-like enzyme